MSNGVNDGGGSRRAYLPGSWYAAVGSDVTVLLPAAAKARVAAVWEQVDDGAGFDQTLDVLLSSGLRELSDFVLVGGTGDATRILVRGQGRVSCDTSEGAVEVVAGAGCIWSERTLTGVDAITVEVETDSTGDESSVTAGLVRVSRVTWGGGAVVGSAPDSSAVAPAEVETELFPAPEPLPVAEALKAVVPEPVAVAVPEPAVEEPDPVVVAGAALGPQTVGVPVAVPVEEGADHDGDTTIGTPGEVVAEPPGIPGQPPAPSVTARPVARLVLSSGESIEVDRAILVGRAPEARRFTSTDQPRLVTVQSPNHEISSTHLEIRPGSGVDHGMSVATDLGSTNGTLLMQPGLPPEELQPGIAASLIPGAIIDLGDGVTIQVTNP